MRDPGGIGVLVAVAAVIALGALTELEAPGDVGTWAPVALDGSALSAVVATSAGMMVGGHAGVALVSADGRVRDLGIEDRVHDLHALDDAVLAATDDGVRWIDRETGDLRDLGPRGRVDEVTMAPSGVLARANEAVLRLDDDGTWEPVLGSGANTVTVIADDVIVGLDGGLAVIAPDGRIEWLLEGPPIHHVAVTDLGGDTRMFAASHEHPRIWAAPGPIGPWQPSDDGLRLATVEAVASDPDRGLVFAAGTGLADGEQTGGVAQSDDAGRTWRDRDDRLAAVQVYDLAVRTEPLRVNVSIAGTDIARMPVTLPRTRTYAATNGAGLYAMQAPLPFAGSGSTLPISRIIVPIALGVLALTAAWRAFGAVSGPRRHAPQNTSDTRPVARQDSMRRELRRTRKVEPL
jgi:hypothetical protein